MSHALFDLRGKHALVTGSGSGIGLGMAEGLLEAGCRVVLHSRGDNALTEAQRLRGEGFDARAVTGDMAEESEIRRVFDEALEQLDGRIDILVNCAGGYSARILKVDGYFPTMEPSAIDWGIDVNLKGPVHFARAVVKHMIDQKSGVIINVGSTCGTVGNSALDYSTAKSGVMNGLTKSLALYGAKHGVRCCCVTPGPVLTRPSMAGMATPLGFAAEPWEVVDLILYLCSDNARSMTGAEYLVDGGRSASALDAAGY